MSDIPRLKHNATLCSAFIRDNKVVSRYPKVSEQVNLVPLDKSLLFHYGYNPAIADDGGKLIMVYRFHPDETARTTLAKVEYDSNMIPGAAVSMPWDKRGAEDPKLFHYQGRLHMSFVDSTWPEIPPKAVVRYQLFNGNSVVPRLPGNDMSSIQKNYVFFEREGKLWCIYQTSPEQIVFSVEGEKVSEEMRSACPQYPYGQIKGGTPPVEWDGNLLRFAHSTLDNEWQGHRRRYYILAVVHEPVPPFKILRTSRKPIIYGSEIDDIPISERDHCKHWKANVVFPSGLLVRGKEFWVSFGVNDSSCEIARIEESQLNL